MSHKATDSEDNQPELELLEHERRSEEKYVRLSKDVLGLQTERDLILYNHIPEIVNKQDRIENDIILLREDYSDTNRLVRKMYYDMIPALHAKMDNLSIKVENVIGKVDNISILIADINHKLDKLLSK